MANESPVNPYEAPQTEPLSVEGGRSSPGLMANRSFWGLLFTQFLGAFNDNVFKQLMLLLAIPAAVSVGSAATVIDPAKYISQEEYDQAVQKLGASAKNDSQGLATTIFSLPFVLFSGFAGFLADRYSKRTIIVAAKVAEIGIMGLGLIGFLYYGQTGFAGLLVVLFLMGTHSAFFGPPKYGVLPQIVTEEELPRANGLILMTTFLAIIFGTALAGGMKTILMRTPGDAERMWMGSLGCIAIAVVGTLTSLLIRPLPPQSPQLKFHWDTIGIPRETLALLKSDRPLFSALMVSCLFWLMSGIAVQAVNSLGKVQLGLSDALTSLLTAAIGIGIASGAVISGKFTHGATDFRFVARGAWGIVITLLLVAVSLPASGGWKHLLGFGGSLPVLILLGASAGMFAVPVQVFLQTRPPKDQKGRIIAAMNLTNFIAIMLSGVVYAGMDRLANAAGLPRSFIFVLIAALMVPLLLRKNGGLGEIPKASTPH